MCRAADVACELVQWLVAAGCRFDANIQWWLDSSGKPLSPDSVMAAYLIRLRDRERAP